ncbi:hypothetical protein C3920_15535 [Novacetimonas pomaceti]|uniref:Uncharacterized protein n=1 Tax=Novacetimonas pomaceti TaxID=2021998 RepID=A0ABX5P0L2_9PROT|nr:hypothetical protein C3920_15535 [Novacetimonas pomaceti]
MIDDIGNHSIIGQKMRLAHIRVLKQVWQTTNQFRFSLVRFWRQDFFTNNLSKVIQKLLLLVFSALVTIASRVQNFQKTALLLFRQFSDDHFDDITQTGPGFAHDQHNPFI